MEKLNDRKYGEVIKIKKMLVNQNREFHICNLEYKIYKEMRDFMEYYS